MAPSSKVAHVFEGIQSALGKTLQKLKGEAKLKPAHVEEALGEIRTSLLEADVQYQVAQRFLEKTKERALGARITEGLSPYQEFLKILSKEMLSVLGNVHEFELSFKPPVIVFMIGLQGSGKTTSSVKLALYAKKKLKRKPLLVSVDVTRPAAIEQLERLSKDAKIDCFSSTSMNPLDRAQQAVKYAQTYGLDLLIVDTAGRLSIDQQMMDELKSLKIGLSPHHLLYVADAMSGQQGLQVASGFASQVGITGAVLSKSDADTRGGVAFSLREALGVPLRFVGTGETIDQFDVFHPDRWVSRILGLGDLQSLFEKAEEVAQAEKPIEKDQIKRLTKGEMTLVDYQEMMKMLKKMGSLGGLMGMIPGMSQFRGKIDPEMIEGRMKRIDAAICSMTAEERVYPAIINGDRKKRISRGSGIPVEEINQFLREFGEMQKMMKRMGGMKGMGSMMPFMGGRR
jgi:signal recognition particle subunit SRP54